MSSDKDPSNSSSGGGFVFPTNTQIRQNDGNRETDAINAKSGREGVSKGASDRSEEANSKNRDTKKQD